MLKKRLSGIVLTLLFTMMLTLAFSIQLGETHSATAVPDDHSTIQKPREDSFVSRDSDTSIKLDMRRKDLLQRFAWSEDNSVQLSVGIDLAKQEVQELRRLNEMILREGGEVTNTVSIGDRVRALSVKTNLDNAYTFAEKLLADRLVRSVEPSLKFETCFTPNDEYWSLQWGPQKIEADAAWETTVGSSGVLVAIIDTGIDYTHPDLAENYVALGYDWANNDTDPKDDMGHGTHVAGTVAAAINNSVGIAGVARVSIMAEKVLNLFGSGSEEWVGNGILHATDQGAKIISMSLGTSFEPSEWFYDIIKYAYNHGVLLVAAAGNTGCPIMGWPAAYDEVIAVSATDATDRLASFSSYGNWVDVSAPGVNVYSTMPTYHVTLNSWGYSMNYSHLSGTSMAAPHVSGVAALGWSAFPNYTRDQLRLHLMFSTDDLGESGIDPFYGYGRINARKAVAGAWEHDVGIFGWCVPYRLLPGQTGRFNATIFNLGKNNETDVSVELLANSTLVDQTTIDFLANFTSTQISFSWNTPTAGKYNITIYVVPVVGESYTKNNVASSIIVVRYATTLIVPDDFQTIQDALDHTISFDTVFVRSGTYNESVSINTDSVRLIGENKSTTIISATGPLGVCLSRLNITVSGFTIKDAYFYGILVYYPWNIPAHDFISDNIITANNFAGMMIQAGSSVLRNNTFYNNEGANINIEGTEQTYFQDIDTSNTVDGKPVYYLIGQRNLQVPSDAGYVALVNCENVTIKNIETTRMGPTLVAYCRNIRIENSTILKNNPYGIEVRESENITLIGNNIRSNINHGISVKDSNHVEIINNTLTDSGNDGVYLAGGGSNNLTGNDLTLNGRCGITVENSIYNTIQNNTISSNRRGLMLYSASSTKLSRNRFSGSQQHIGVYGTVLLDYIQDIDTTNTINGRPINYLVNQDNVLLDGKIITTGYIAVINSTNIIIRNISIKETGQILLLAFSTNVTLTQNIFTTYSSVEVYNSDFNNITQNVLASVSLVDSSHNFFKHNDIISENALFLSSSHNNIFKENTLRPNGPAPGTNVELILSDGNSFSLNNFIAIEPPNGFHVSSTNSTNIWDDGSRGNYWTQHQGVDQNGDGIADNPYVIDESNEDRYPLMKAFSDTVGDINKDSKVDIKDIALAARSYGSYPGDPRWNPIADITGPTYLVPDGQVDIRDIALIASKFGKIYT